MSKDIKEVEAERMAAVAEDLRRFNVAFKDAYDEAIQSKHVVSPSKKRARARRASLDLTQSLAQWRRSPLR